MGLAQETEIFVQTVDASTVRAGLEAKEILLVDVREVREFEAEHIPGALLLPLSGFDAEMFPRLPGKRVVLHCAIGKRSEAAGKMLIKQGFSEVFHMEGGLKAWKEAGFETEQQPVAAEPAAVPLFSCPPPGRVLEQEFLAPLGLSPAVLAQKISVSEGTIRSLLQGDLRVDAELSLRLSRYFSTAADFWVQLQLAHDIERARHALGERIRLEIRPRAA